ncbi:MAG: hypothetical protein M3O36_06635 [Myxococcota bacterium]|nr:hypothetical protein [Myxococcota bacterium]
MRRGPTGLALARRLAVTYVVAAALLAACKSRYPGDTDGRGPDGAADAREGGLARMTMDASPTPADDAIPATSSEELTVRARHLLEAIAKDDAELAVDIVFPRDAWLATRDAADPGKDWERRVTGPFRKAVHGMSRKHKNLLSAQFASLELGRSVEQVTPRRHSWKKALWTVNGARLTFVVDGHTRTLPIREMTGWRGAWYVTRLR